eukprot:scaffold65072_cov31-Phaeocystis_antarctica.AAC.2
MLLVLCARHRLCREAVGRCKERPATPRRVERVGGGGDADVAVGRHQCAQLTLKSLRKVGVARRAASKHDVGIERPS